MVLPAALRIALAVWRLFRLYGTSKILPVLRLLHFSCEPFALFQYWNPSAEISLATVS